MEADTKGDAQDLKRSVDIDESMAVQENGDLVAPHSRSRTGSIASEEGLADTENSQIQSQGTMGVVQYESDSEQPIAKFKRPCRSKKAKLADTLEDDTDKGNVVSAGSPSDLLKENMINENGNNMKSFSSLRNTGDVMLVDTDGEEEVLDKFKRSYRSKKALLKAALEDDIDNERKFNQEREGISPHMNTHVNDGENEGKQPSQSGKLEHRVEANDDEEGNLVKIRRPQRLKRGSKESQNYKPIENMGMGAENESTGFGRIEDKPNEPLKEMKLNLGGEESDQIMQKNNIDEFQSEPIEEETLSKLIKGKKLKNSAIDDTLSDAIDHGKQSSSSKLKSIPKNNDTEAESKKTKVKKAKTMGKGKEARKLSGDKPEELKDIEVDNREEALSQLKRKRARKVVKGQAKPDTLSRQESATETDQSEAKVEVGSKHQKAGKPGKNSSDCNPVGAESGSTLNSGKERRQSDIQRTSRRTKKRRHGDMAYEGDSDWDVLMNGETMTENDSNDDKDRFGYRSKGEGESTPGRKAAVAAGLKSRSVIPAEKIRFREVLKRRGGLLEYLECRNSILSLWSKDVRRILPLSDCGVSEHVQPDEAPRSALIRDIYKFLDSNGYINVGIAVDKPKAKEDFQPKLKISKESIPTDKVGDKVVDTEEEVAFILGQIKGSDENHSLEQRVTKAEGESQTSFFSAEEVKPKADAANCVESFALNRKDSDESGIAIMDTDENSVVAIKNESNLKNSENQILTVKHEDDPMVNEPISKNIKFYGEDEFSEIDSAKVLHDLGRQNLPSSKEMDERKRILVIGAGPSGLAAARHLKCQNFNVLVLEARDRVGGRVYTDRTSLSVPVDLGASIITGVEADMTTERRPDPSALLCTQLGLELTVLESACPMYDSVTGTKVPADIDEALETEFNALLDDMARDVDQYGDETMSKSLEEGFENALKKRRSSHKVNKHPECMVALCEEHLEGGLDEKPAAKENEPAKLDSNDLNLDCEILKPLERRVMDWHFAHLEYGCAAELKLVSLPNWNQDDVYGGFGGPHCMIKGGYSKVMEALAEGLNIHCGQVVTDIKYNIEDSDAKDRSKKIVKVQTDKGQEFIGDVVLITVPLGCLKSKAINFSPELPEWKQFSIERLGFGVLNKVVMEFPSVFWDESLDYFGVTAESTDLRGRCFMFWNLKKTVGAPVLIALVVGKAAIDGKNIENSEHVKHALRVLRKVFGEDAVPEPIASVTTNWGADPFSLGAYSYVAVGSSGEDYDILGRPVENCLFFAGEATCKEHPDTVGGAIMSGVREAVRIMTILENGKDLFAEAEAMVAAQRQSDSERTEVSDMMKRLEASDYPSRDALLQDMYGNAKTTVGRLFLAKKMLQLPESSVKAFAGTKEGLSILNRWILDSLGKDGTQLLRHCVRLLLVVSTDMLSVRQSGIGRTVKEKVCVHTSRDIRAIASQLVKMWIEIFRKEKANGGLKLLKQPHVTVSNSGSLDVLKVKSRDTKLATSTNIDTKGNSDLSNSGKEHKKEHSTPAFYSADAGQQRIAEDAIIAELEAKAIAAEAAARAAVVQASSQAECSTIRELPKIPSFHKFAKREHLPPKDEPDVKKRKWSGAVLGKQDCSSEIDSRSCRVKNWSVDFSATCGNLDGLAGSDYGGLDSNRRQRSHSNDIDNHSDLKEQSAETGMGDSKASKLQGQNSGIKIPSKHRHGSIDKVDDEACNNRGSLSSRNVNKDEPRGPEHIKKGIADYVASLLMPLYKTRKIDKDGYKSIMKKSTIKVLEHNTSVENAMSVAEFLDCKRRNKIRSLVDKFIERHLANHPS